MTSRGPHSSAGKIKPISLLSMLTSYALEQFTLCVHKMEEKQQDTSLPRSHLLTSPINPALVG